MKTFLSLALFVFALPAQAAQFKYNELMIKDYDEMTAMVQGLVKKARALNSDDGAVDSEAIEHLREALKLIFSRPNSDNMIVKLMPEVRRELTGLSAYEDSLSSLASEALSVVKKDNAAVSHQATSLFILENLLGEIRPEAPGNEDLRRIVERVSEAKIKISDEVRKDMKLRGMFKTRNPSELADEILKGLPKNKKK
ncbi:MAG TPA: hypothetical protein PKC28_09865 [Bdellovibrionales bacterium]|nr:hypothetical protein [Bdellovibrionales bacterium]